MADRAGEERDPLARVCAAFLDHLSAERALADNTLAAYRRDLRRYRAYLADRKSVV